MAYLTRRRLMATGAVALLAPQSRVALATTDANRRFVAEAERMRREAIAAGDQGFGAVVVKDGVIVGWGPSRVVTDRNPDAHAERVALWDAERRLGSVKVAGAIVYATFRPCSACQNALA